MLHILLLFFVVAARISGMKADPIYACSGDSVLLFQNMSQNFSQTDTFLYKNTTLIAIWSKSKDAQEEERVSYDSHGNIWMRSINISDDETYKVSHDIDHKHNNVRKEVRLIVLVPPEKSCRPQIECIGNTLIASLKTGAACGNSEVTVYWLDYPYEALESQAKANLSLGREKGTYYACIETPALRCARGSKPVDFCSSLTIDECMAFCLGNDYIYEAVIIAVMGCCSLLLAIVVTECSPLDIKKKSQSNSSNQRPDGMSAQFLMTNSAA